jgi:hypothetical protein
VSAKAKAARAAAYGALIVVAIPVTAALSIAVDRARVWRNTKRWAK